MIYLVNQQAQHERFFSQARMYSDVEWANLDQVIIEFRRRISDWYLEPAKCLATNIHFAFSLMALNCLMIDTLSQFTGGHLSSSRSEFIGFVGSQLPAYGAKLPRAIRHADGTSKEKSLTNVAEVIYFAFRCGILHQAHLPPYAAVVPNAPQSVQVIDPGPVMYSDTRQPCPLVVVDPLALYADVLGCFERYIEALADRKTANDSLRAHFKQKFSASFGVDISPATFT